MRQPGAAAARLLGELARPLTGRPTLRTAALDLLLWAALCVPVLLELATRAAGAEGAFLLTPAEAAAGAAVAAAAVAVSRPYPIAAALLALALALLSASSFAPTLFVLCYLFGRRDPRGWAAAAACGAAIVVLAAGSAADPRWLLSAPGLLISYVINAVLPWMAGSYRRQRANLDEAGWERARRLEREQSIAADQVRLRERSRIAQDMHDSLGHELSLIALRAGALELAPDLTERHRTAAGELRESATTATERLRAIVSVLRDTVSAAPIAPADEEITDVVERARRSGVDVVLERSGSWEGIAPMVDRAAHRVVQEGLTNATKHAPGAAVRVRLERSAQETAVTVANAASPEAPPLAADASGGGNGLIGLAERVRLAGGTLRAEAHGDGFAVAATFPASDAAAGAAAADPPDRAEPSAAEAQRHEARRGLRRRTVRMAAAAAALLVCGVVFAAGSAYLRWDAATMDPADYAKLRVGAPAERVEAQLPLREYGFAVERDDSEAADRFACRYYRAQQGLLPGEYSIYRLCFDGGELVSKDSMPELGPYPGVDP